MNRPGDFTSRPVRQYGAGRTCVTCPTKLSQYNPFERCATCRQRELPPKVRLLQERDA